MYRMANQYVQTLRTAFGKWKQEHHVVNRNSFQRDMFTHIAALKNRHRVIVFKEIAAVL